MIEGLLARCRDQIVASRARADRTQHLQVVQNWGAQAGARTNHLCFDLYDLPQIPHRIAEELGGAARFLIREGECPFCRLVREEVRRPDRLLYEDDSAVAFAPYASPLAVRGVGRPAPPRRGLRPRHRRDIAATGEALRQVLGELAASLDGPPYNLVLHTAPLREQVDATYHWHWEIHPRLREIAGLELGTGLPVNPVSPEDAVEELRDRDPGGRRTAGAPAAVIGLGGADGRHTRCARASSQRPGARPAPDRGEQPIQQHGARVVADSFDLEQRVALPGGPRRERGVGPRRGLPLRRGAVRPHQNEIYAYLSRMLRDPELAADLTQDAFVKAYQRLRLAREARERPRVAVPDRPSRRARQPPPPARSSGSCRWSARRATRRRRPSTS